MTRLLSIDRDEPDPKILDEAASALKAGGLVAFPTETVYGLGADATDPVAVARIFAAKGRPSNNPLIVHVASRQEARECVSHWPESASIVSDLFWPGPLTLVLPRASWVPDLVTAGRDTVGVRIPRPAVARRLISAAGRPLAAPSANRSTGISPTEARHVLKDLSGKVDVILDAGPTEVGLESTVLDLSGPVPILLRPGRVTLEAISRALNGGRVDTLGTPKAGAFSSPGQMEIHYAPRTPTWIVPAENLGDRTRNASRSALILFGDQESLEEGPIGAFVRLAQPEFAEERLYATLHRLDEEGWDAILIVPPPDRPEWRAIRDRIRRAGRSADRA